jgi:PEGA domain
MRRSCLLLSALAVCAAFTSNADAAPKRKRTASPKAPAAAPAASKTKETAPPAATETPAAPAAPKSLRDELPKEALHDWDAARELYDAKDFEGATVEFLRVYALSKNPRVLFNVAICQKNLAHYARAVEYLRRMLAEAGASLAEAEQQRAREAIDTIQVFVTGLVLKVSEPNAVVTIDGREVEGRTPFAKAIPVEVGTHTIVVRKAGFRDATLNIDAAAKIDAEPPVVTLEPLVRRGVVAVTVAGAPLARVLVDGVEMGFAPYTGEFPVGRHTVDAKAIGYVGAAASVELALDQRLAVDLELRQEKHEGRVRIEAAPAGAALFLDGKALGADHWEGVLPSGGHQVVARREGFEPQSTEVNVADDQVRTVRLELQPRRGRNDWIWWSLGSVAVVGASAFTGYMLLKPQTIDPQPGTLQPGIALTN